ncbi:MAG: ABC-2 family transporter protein [Kineosporiaceae bacterium]|nr:ABC-2 family transporter protein [Kineosporiaceae bacterium]
MVSVVLTSFLVTAGSLAFFTDRSEPAALSLHAVLLFASYPIDIFGGPLELLLYTMVPAAFVAAVPARLIDHPSPPEAVLLVVATVAFASLAWGTFTLGLRRYASGSAWSRD